MKLFPTVVTTLALAASASTTHAATQLGEYFTFSGFGTLGAVRTNTDQALFGRDRQAYGGADTSGSLEVDSNLGLQATATANSWLSATAQVVTVKRQTEDHLTTEAEWGFVKVAPLQGLSIRGGRMPVPVFMVSDSINVGYANNWLRAPNEVYGLVSFRRMQGFDLTYQLPIGPTTLTTTVFAGTSVAKSGSGVFGIKDIVGANLQLETEWATFRYGQIDAKYDTAAQQAYTFKSVGASVDRDNIVFQAEYVKRIVPAIAVLNSNGWYIMGGYRFGTVLPYAMYGSTDPKTVSPANVADKQRTTALGLRWDAFKSASLKAQVERIDTKGTKGISFVGLNRSGSNPSVRVTSPVTAISASVDFVF